MNKPKKRPARTPSFTGRFVQLSSLFVGRGVWVMLWVGLMLSFSGCKDLLGDLQPSGEDLTNNRTQTLTFNAKDMSGATVNIQTLAAGHTKTMIYFTMWCPICDSHMSHLWSSIIPNYPNVGFYVVDYVSGSWTLAKQNRDTNGYTNAPFTVLSDDLGEIDAEVGSTMGLVLILDSSANLLASGDFRNGAWIEQELSAP